MTFRRQLITASSKTPVKDPATGTLTVRFPVQQQDMMVYRIEIEGPANSLARVHVGFDASAGTYRSVSYFGQLDDADYDNGLLVPQAQGLLICWYDVSAGITSPAPIIAAGNSAIANAEIELDDPRRGRG